MQSRSTLRWTSLKSDEHSHWAALYVDSTQSFATALNALEPPQNLQNCYCLEAVLRYSTAKVCLHTYYGIAHACDPWTSIPLGNHVPHYEAS